MMVTIFWYLSNKATGNSVETGSYGEVIYARDLLAAEHEKLVGRRVRYEDRKRTMIVEVDDREVARYEINKIQVSHTDI